MAGGLFESYSDTNKRILETPSVVEKPTGQVIPGSESGMYKVVQRTETERYQYFGMTEAAAATCTTAIEALSSDSVSYKASGTPVGDSPMWNVNVTKVKITITVVEII